MRIQDLTLKQKLYSFLDKIDNDLTIASGFLIIIIFGGLSMLFNSWLLSKVMFFFLAVYAITMLAVIFTSKERHYLQDLKYFESACKHKSFRV